MKGKKWSALLLLLFLLSLFSEPGDIYGPEKTEGQDYPVSVKKLTTNIYRITIEYGLRPNIVALAGLDGVLLIDTGHKQVADSLLSAVKDLHSGELRFIVNTHLHGDHTGANLLIRKNAEILNCKNLEHYVTEGPISRDNEELKGKSGHSFKPYYSLLFNREQIKLIPHPGIHSDADLLVYFSDSGVVHMGDLLLTQSFPAVGGKIPKYLEFLDKVIDVFPSETKYIAGHGRDYSMNDLKDYRQMLLTTIDIVRKEMEKGKSEEETIQARVLERWESWGEFLEFLNVDYWIKAIYSSYK